MVVFLDFEDDEDQQDIPFLSDGTPGLRELSPEDGRISQTLPTQDLSRGAMSGFARALSCYPAALSLASHLDLNDLHSLSLTCHDIHDNMGQFAHQLVRHSLRCSNASQPLLADIINRYKDSIVIRDATRTGGHNDPQAVANALPGLLASLSSSTPSSNIASRTLLQSSKIGACAPDLVAACRRCETVVCRNCSAKPPSDRCLQDRFRRLCKACLKAPLTAHLQPFRKQDDRVETPPASSASSVRSTPSVSSSSASPLPGDDGADRAESSSAFTAEAFMRGPCTCATRGVYLCTACGQNLRAADTTYKRVWTWRSRYSTHIGGGLGTGLGSGDQGQKCGRGENCLEGGTGGVCWVEIDCSESNKREAQPYLETVDGIGTDHEREGEERDRDKPGYLQQEIEGIGGVVKKKVKKRVKVGATVWEYDDERETGMYLEREASGRERSWCGWCSRVVPGREDRA